VTGLTRASTTTVEPRGTTSVAVVILAIEVDGGRKLPLLYKAREAVPTEPVADALYDTLYIPSNKVISLDVGV
jgi:hypothetical protein